MMRKATLFIVFVLTVVLLQSCHTISQQSGGITVVRSDSDYRNYKYLELANGLRVLLVSDSRTDKAAAALDVLVGSGQDPENRAGLAHFLEHMLFLGTEKFPDAGAYQAYISENGGSHNAYTSFEHTNYFFDIDKAKFEPALARFSQFFIAPLFTDQYVEREKNAVHSEYQAKIKDDARRELDVFKSVINQAHPFAKFSVGNLDTLSGDTVALRKDLIDFYHRYYSAQRMTLTLYGNESISELETLALRYFSEIPRRDIPELAPIAEPVLAAEELPLMIELIPEAERRELSINFPLPEQLRVYENKPVEYIANLLGHEGSGSLLSMLKEEGLAESLSAGSGLNYRGGSMLSINIGLTVEGLENRDRVIEAVFATITQIAKTGIAKHRYDEQSRLAEIQFRFKDNGNPIYEVSGLARNLHIYSPKNVLRGAYFMEHYDSGLIEEFVGYMQPSNAIITVAAKSLKTDKISPYYDVPYRVSAIDDALIKRWTNPGKFVEITLPQTNQFVPESLKLVNAPEEAVLPTLMVADDNVKLWYQFEKRFPLPKGELYANIISPNANKSAEAAAHMHMYARMVREQLNEFAYPASLAGLSYGVSANNKGLLLRLSGYNDKQLLLLEQIVSGLKQPLWRAEVYERLRLEALRSLKNANKRAPYRILFDDLNEAINFGWTEQQLLSVYEQLNVRDTQHFIEKQFSEKLSTEILLVGNYSGADIKQVGLLFGETFEGVNGVASSPDEKILKLPQQRSEIIVDSNHDDAAVILYFQPAAIARIDRAAMGLTAQLMSAAFYTDLRTNQQLGYIVNAGAFPNREVPGITFLVQSPVASTAKLERAVGKFIRTGFSADDIDQQKFEQNKQALIGLLQEKPKNLTQQSQRYWRDLNDGYAEFNSRDLLVDALERLSLEQWKVFYKTTFASASSRSLLLRHFGKFGGKLHETSYENVEKFLVDQAFYTF